MTKKIFSRYIEYNKNVYILFDNLINNITTNYMFFKLENNYCN